MIIFHRRYRAFEAVEHSLDDLLNTAVQKSRVADGNSLIAIVVGVLSGLLLFAILVIVVLVFWMRRGRRNAASDQSTGKRRHNVNRIL